MHKSIVILAMLTVAVPLMAQQQMGDPTKKISGSGKLPDGWMVRFDPIDNPANVRPGRTAPPAPKLEQVDVRASGNAIDFKTGPAGIYWNTKDMGSGEFAITATFTAKKSMTHEAYGIFLGGHNLEDSTQSYIYFEVRPGMGDSVFVQQRNGDVARNIVKLMPWTSSKGAVMVDDPGDGHSTNTLYVHVAKDEIHFVVNGKPVGAVPKSALKGGSTDGQTGIRINHNTDIHVEWKGVSK